MKGIKPAPSDHESKFKWMQFRVGAIPSEPESGAFFNALVLLLLTKFDQKKSTNRRYSSATNLYNANICQIGAIKASYVY